MYFTTRTIGINTNLYKINVMLMTRCSNSLRRQIKYHVTYFKPVEKYGRVYQQTDVQGLHITFIRTGNLILY